MTGGNGLVPVLVLAAAMTSTLAAAALAMNLTPRGHHCARHRHQASMAAPAASFARPAAPAPRAPLAPIEVSPHLAPAAPVAPPVTGLPEATDCAPRVYRAGGDTQEWTFEVCAGAPEPRLILVEHP